MTAGEGAYSGQGALSAPTFPTTLSLPVRSISLMASTHVCRLSYGSVNIINTLTEHDQVVVAVPHQPNKEEVPPCRTTARSPLHRRAAAHSCFAHETRQ